MIRQVKKGESGYPEQFLRPSLKNPPEQVFMEGREELLKPPVLAVVGSRKCSPYGASVSRKSEDRQPKRALHWSVEWLQALIHPRSAPVFIREGMSSLCLGTGWISAIPRKTEG